MIRAISLWQPWASLWLSERKVHETRGWPIKVGDVPFWLGVHAAKSIETNIDSRLREIVEDEFGPDWQRELPRGAIIGRVLIDRCVSMENMNRACQMPRPGTDDFECGDWSFGRFAWHRSHYQVLREAIPCRGQQGLFSVPEWAPELEIAA